MRVEDFPRPKNDNRRGVHWTASIYHLSGSALDPWIAELRALHIKWVKLLDDGGGSSRELCQRLLAADIMPIVRLYRHQPNPGHIGGRETDTARGLIADGVRYFETNNEPDLSAEWDDHVMPNNWLDVVLDNFIIDADTIIGLGGLPALPAMGVGSAGNPVARVVAKGRGDLFERGAWVAIHNYALNHPLEYPYDAVNQSGTALSRQDYDKLGAWAWDNQPLDLINQWRASDKNPGDTVADDASCFLSFRYMDDLIVQALGHKVPIISTEGGVMMGTRDDRRYPRLAPQMHADLIVAIDDFMQGNREIQGARCPNNYFSMCHWLLGNYRLGFFDVTWESQSWYTDWWNTTFSLKGQLPVVAAVKAMPNLVVDDAYRGVITGHVVGAETGAPLPSVRVELRVGDTLAAATTTGTDGAFQFKQVQYGTYDLAVGPWGIVKQGLVVSATALDPLTIRVSDSGKSTISGTIVDFRGAAIAGVTVTLTRDGATVAETKTEAKGTFQFAGLPLGVYRIIAPNVTVVGMALDGKVSKTLKLTAGASSGLRYVVTQRRLLPQGETAGRDVFYGTVIDAAGKPLNGIKLRMSWQGAAAGTMFPVTTTGKDPYRSAGTYVFVHTRGIFRVDVVQGDYPSDAADNLDTANVPGLAGKHITYEVSFQIKNAEAPAGVEGQVPGGKAGCKLTLKRLDPPQDTTDVRNTELKADGTFAFASVPPGQYSLELANTGVVASDIILHSGGLWMVLLPMRSRLQGQALSAPSGTVAVLHAPAPWTWTRQAPLAPNGVFAFDGLPAGRYRLQVADQTLADLQLTGENVLQLQPLDLGQGRRSAVHGVVRDASGRVQPDILMTLRKSGTVLAQIHTGADGTYRFANLPSGTYALEVEGMGVVAADLTLDGEHEVVHDVRWTGPAPNGIIQGRVLLTGGAAQAGVLVRLLQDKVELSITQTDAAGAFRFSALAAGVYALAVGNGDPLVTGLSVSYGATVVKDLVLAKSAKLIARYVLLAKPTAGAPVSTEVRLALALALPYLRQTGATAGFSLEEASQACEVLIVGDQVAASAEETLRKAGCQASRLAGDSWALADAFRRLLAKAGQG